MQKVVVTTTKSLKRPMKVRYPKDLLYKIEETKYSHEPYFFERFLMKLSRSLQQLLNIVEYRISVLRFDRIIIKTKRVAKKKK